MQLRNPSDVVGYNLERAAKRKDQFHLVYSHDFIRNEQYWLVVVA